MLIATIFTCPQALPVTGSPEVFRIFIDFIKAQLFTSLPKCTNLVITTTNDGSFQSSSSNGSQETVPIETQFSTRVEQNTSGNSEEFWSPMPTQHYRPCSLLFFDISTSLLPADRGGNVTLDFNNWSILPYAGSIHSSFYFFIIQTAELPELETTTATVLEFAKTTRAIQNAFFVFAQPIGDYAIFGRNAHADTLTPIYRHKHLHYHKNAPLFLAHKLNFEGSVMVVTLCPVCDKPFVTFDETQYNKNWNNHLAGTTYELAVWANATLELATVFGAPKAGLTLEGDWDDFVLPLIEGTAAITQMIEQTVENRKAVFSSSITLFDSVAFITNQPKVLRVTSLARLAKPLRMKVWIGIGVSFLCVFFVLEMVIRVRRTVGCTGESRKYFGKAAQFLSPAPRHQFHWTAFALATAALDQAAVGGEFANSARWHSSRLLIGLWYLMWIVVGCAYKSDLTAMIVKPVFIQPPRTFEELIESDYKVGALFYSGNLEEQFLALNNSISRAIQTRVYEYDFLEPDVS